jgi:radial spoke head protein 4A
VNLFNFLDDDNFIKSDKDKYTSIEYKGDRNDKDDESDENNESDEDDKSDEDDESDEDYE